MNDFNGPNISMILSTHIILLFDFYQFLTLNHFSILLTNRVMINYWIESHTNITRKLFFLQEINFLKVSPT